jgi:glycosyltransferase involved in cell wall biosynthesis
MATPYSILFITANMGGGGAERALINIINHLDRGFFKPHLALFQKEGIFLKDLASDVPVYEIQPVDYGFLHRNLVRFWKIKQLSNHIHPYLIMSVQWQVNIVTLMTQTLFNLGCPVVVNEQVALKRGSTTIWQKHLFWPLAKRVYTEAAKSITISNGIATELQEELSLPKDHFRVIHNPVSLEEIREQASQYLASDFRSDSIPRLIAVGRLEKQKNYPLLIHALSKVIELKPVRLDILGEGTERPHLEALIQSLELGKYVHLLGFQSNPFVHMHQADIFVLSSDFEGFGNVIVEAMALGKPVIATDCPYGPAEILREGEYGILVPPGDEQALSKAILYLLQNPIALEIMSEKAKKRAEYFSIDHIIPHYELLFLELIEAYGSYQE